MLLLYNKGLFQILINSHKINSNYSRVPVSLFYSSIGTFHQVSVGFERACTCERDFIIITGLIFIIITLFKLNIKTLTWYANIWRMFFGKGFINEWNGIQTHNHLVRKITLNYLAKLANLKLGPSIQKETDSFISIITSTYFFSRKICVSCSQNYSSPV